jgi:hypothetical protein
MRMARSGSRNGRLMMLTGRAEGNFVCNATLDNVLNLHIEDGDFKAEAINWLNARWKLLNRG